MLWLSLIWCTFDLQAFQHIQSKIHHAKMKEWKHEVCHKHILYGGVHSATFCAINLLFTQGTCSGCTIDSLISRKNFCVFFARFYYHTKAHEKFFPRWIKTEDCKQMSTMPHWIALKRRWTTLQNLIKVFQFFLTNKYI